jgi:hypothetical protein
LEVSRLIRSLFARTRYRYISAAHFDSGFQVDSTNNSDIPDGFFSNNTASSEVPVSYARIKPYNLYLYRITSSENLDVFVMINPSQMKIPEKSIPKIDVIFVIILLIATLSTAFCVYQATRWNGFQAVDFGDASKYRTESVRASTTANTQIIIDVQLFTTWVDAVSKGELVQAKFIRDRFRKEFKPAFEAWIAMANATNPIPPGSPFDLPEYTLAEYNESVLLEEKATAAFNEGKDANTNGDLYISNTVLFAIVLFFCGIYSRWDSIRIRKGILILTLIVFAFALYSLGSLLLKVGYV